MDLFHLSNTWRTLSNIPHNSYIFRNCTFYVLCMVKSTIDSYINVLKWIRYLHRSILKITYCLFIKCTFKNCERGFLIIDVKALLFVILMVLIQATVILFVKGEILPMMIEVILMVCLIMIQLMIGHLWHQIGWSYTKAILLMCLPLGIGLYLMQLFYYETRYTNWEVLLKLN